MRFFLLAAALFAAAPALAEGFSPPVAATSRAMRFETPEGGPLAFRGAIAVTPPTKRFGAISGLVMEAPGRALAVSDIGDWLRFRLLIEDDRLIGIGDVSLAPILDDGGERAPKGARNAEGLARDPETGRLWVSFEGYHRIWVFDEPGGATRGRVLHPDWTTFRENGGIEALARDRDGRFWATGEDGAAEDFPVWVGAEDTWEMKSIPRRGEYQPTGADFGPDGRLYLTERAFSIVGGFRFRLRRFTWGDGPAPESEETLLTYGAATYIDNIEAVTLWRDDGRTWLLIASDDNLLPVERNVLALYEVLD
ncbi:MAG: esterase-like activity of phytase family protein [Pikeienuella sp.]